MTTLVWNGDQAEIWAKDWELSRFIAKFPHMEPVVSEMRRALPDGKKTYLVDMIARDYMVGESTCTDTRWHFDGDYGGSNDYCLWVRGPNRTEFPETTPPLNPPEERELQNRYLEGLGLVGVEVPEMTVVRYDSSTPHRGRKCCIPGKRLFLRVLGTDKIRAKNFIKRDL